MVIEYTQCAQTLGLRKLRVIYISHHRSRSKLVLELDHQRTLVHDTSGCPNMRNI